MSNVPLSVKDGSRHRRRKILKVGGAKDMTACKKISDHAHFRSNHAHF